MVLSQTNKPEHQKEENLKEVELTRFPSQKTNKQTKQHLLVIITDSLHYCLKIGENLIVWKKLLLRVQDWVHIQQRSPRQQLILFDY